MEPDMTEQTIKKDVKFLLSDSAFMAGYGTINRAADLRGGFLREGGRCGQTFTPEGCLKSPGLSESQVVFPFCSVSELHPLYHSGAELFTAFTDAREWLDVYGKDFLNHDMIVMPLKDVEAYRQSVESKSVFVRPLLAHKVFCGRVINGGDYHKVSDIYRGESFQDVLVYVATEKHITSHERFISVEGQLFVEQSDAGYWQEKQGRQTLAFARKIAKAAPIDICTFDVVRERDDKKNRPRLGEFNIVHCSAFFAIAIEPVLTAIRKFLERKGETVGEHLKARALPTAPVRTRRAA
jgi:hypothetical protein